MHKHWNDTILPIIKKVKPKYIVEISSGTGINTRNILEYCKDNDSKLISIDSSPNFDVNELKEKYKNKFEFYEDLSLNILPFLEKFDIILINEYYNEHALFNELNTIEKMYKKNKNYPLIFFQDTSWPHCDEDLYYNPENIPEEYLFQYKNLGMIPEEKNLSINKSMNYDLNNAILEDSEKNGVPTSIEDYIKKSSLNLTFYSIPAFQGLGILFLENQELKKIVEDSIDYKTIIENMKKHYLKLFSVDYKTENNNLINILNNEKKKFNQIVSEKDNTIEKLNNEKTTLQNNNKEKDNIIQKLNTEKTTLQNNKTKNDNEIKLLIKENKILIERSEILIKSKEKIYLEHNQTKDKLNFLQRNITEKNNAIQKISKEKTNLENQNNALKLYIEMNNVKLSEIIVNKNKQRQEILDLKTLIKRQQNLINKQRNIMDEQNKEINKYKLSKSWKFTKPLRNLIKIFKSYNN